MEHMISNYIWHVCVYTMQILYFYHLSQNTCQIIQLSSSEQSTFTHLIFMISVIQCLLCTRHFLDTRSTTVTKICLFQVDALTPKLKRFLVIYHYDFNTISTYYCKLIGTKIYFSLFLLSFSSENMSGSFRFKFYLNNDFCYLSAMCFLTFLSYSSGFPSNKILIQCNIKCRLVHDSDAR